MFELREARRRPQPSAEVLAIPDNEAWPEETNNSQAWGNSYADEDVHMTMLHTDVAQLLNGSTGQPLGEFGSSQA